MTKIAAIIALLDKEQAEGIYSPSEQIRNAALYSIMDLGDVSTAEFCEACAQRGISNGTARNRLNQVRRLWGDDLAA